MLSSLYKYLFWVDLWVFLVVLLVFDGFFVVWICVILIYFFVVLVIWVWLIVGGFEWFELLILMFFYVYCVGVEFFLEEVCWIVMLILLCDSGILFIFRELLKMSGFI